MAQDVVVNGTTYPDVETVVMTDKSGNTIPYYPDAVRYSAQTLTEAQKEQARKNIGVDAQVAPEYAPSVEWLDENGDTSKMYVLPDGYIYAFQSGGTKEVFTDVLKDVGYQEKKRINSSGAIVEWETTDVTGYIPAKAGDVIRLKNVYVPDTYQEGGSSYGHMVSGYTLSKTHIKQVYTCYVSNGSNTALDRVVENGRVVQFTVASSLFGEDVAYIVISANDISADSEIYVNSTLVNMDAWASTGIQFVSNGSDESYIPDYWLSELETKSEAIQTAMETAGRNKSAFLWYTDAHWQTNSKMSPHLLWYLWKNTPMNKGNFGGDIINDPSAFTHENIKYAYEWRKLIVDLPNHHSVPGNHDLNHNSTDVRKMAYAFLLAPEESADMVCGDGLYYYIDNPREKTRYIYLDYMTNDQTAMMAQGQFIVDAIKGVNEGWHIVAISHRWFQYTSASAPTVGSVPTYEAEILKIFDEYNARGKHTASNYFYAQDFASGKGKVEFCIGGHIHVDYDFKTSGGIPVIITASDTNQERSSGDTEDSGALGTTTESAVFGIIADYGNGKITVVGVGRGGSRVISY